MMIEKEKLAPSIFNDVIGPVMRGPSSSHVAGGARIGDLVRQAAVCLESGEHTGTVSDVSDAEEYEGAVCGNGLSKLALHGPLKRVVVSFDPNGSLAESHDGHGTDMGFACGILGVPLTDPSVIGWKELVEKSGIDLEYRIEEYGAEHPNYYRIDAETASGRRLRVDAISTGGGMIELVGINGCPVSVKGDKEETVTLHGTGESFHFTPVLPTPTKGEAKVPFRTCEEMLQYNRRRMSPASNGSHLIPKAAGSIFDRRWWVTIPDRRSQELKLPASVNASSGSYGVAVRTEALISGG